MKNKVLLASLLLLVMTNPSPAEDSPAEDPEVTRAKAETAHMNAQAALIKAQTELAAAQNAQSPTVIEANRQKALAETRKAAAEADKAAAEASKGELAAMLPTAVNKGLAGETTAAAGSGYFAQLLAYDALRSLAEEIVDRIADVEVLQANDKVYLTATFDQLQATGLRLLVRTRLANFKYSFEQFKNAFEKAGDGQPKFLAGNESPAALAALPALVGVAADVAAYFKVDRSITGVTTTVADTQLMNQTVAGTWRRWQGRKAQAATAATTAKAAIPTVNFILPGAIVKVPAGQQAKLITAQLMELETSYGNLCTKRDETDRLIATTKGKQTEQTARLAELKAAAAKPPTSEQAVAISAAQRELTITTADLEILTKNNTYLAAVLTSYRTFADSLLAVPTGDTQSPMAKILLNDMLANEEGTAYLLQVAVSSIGGEMETRKWVWGPGKIWHRAGAVCAYTLYKDTGEIVTAGLVAADRQTKEGRSTGTFIKREGY